MKKSITFFTKWFLFLSLGLVINSCKDKVTDVTPKVNETSYIYKGETLIEKYRLEGTNKIVLNDSNSDKINAILNQSNVSVVELSSQPGKIYLFNSFEESEKYLTNTVAATKKYSKTGRIEIGQVIFNLWDGLLGPPPNDLGDNLEIFTIAPFNYITNRYEFYDLRDWTGNTIPCCSWNDKISAMTGENWNPANQAYKVVVWSDPHFTGNSWTIVVQPSTYFNNVNLHATRMNSSHSWGDQISSVYLQWI